MNKEKKKKIREKEKTNDKTILKRIKDTEKILNILEKKKARDRYCVRFV